MADYLDLDVDPVDATQLRQDARDYMAAQAPAGWVMPPLLDWLLAAVARMAVTILVLAGRVPRGIFSYWGQNIVRVPKVAATAATGSVTFTFTSNPAGRTIDAGALVDIDGISFETTADLVVATSTLTGSIGVIARETGLQGSGLTGTTVDLISPADVVWIESVTLDAVTTGGTDGETDDEYVDRLPDEIPTLTPKAVLIDDVSAIARRDPEVFRSLAVDNFVPPSTSGVAGAVTSINMDSAGGDISTPAKTRVEASLEDGRILAIDAHVTDPIRTAVKVSFAATAEDGQDPTAMTATVRQAIKDLLSPLRWGIPSGGAPEDWVDETTLRVNDVVVTIGKVPGIRHVGTVQIALAAGSLGTSNVTLPGPGALPTIIDADLTGSVT